MKKEDFRNLLESWARDVREVNNWYYSQIGRQTLYQHCEEIYQMVKTMWVDFRDVFPNKGTYKMIRRLLIKNIAKFWNMQPGLWRRLPADLCKEILHKADQHWISFNGELQANFREYLIWKAKQAGYTKRRTKNLCYVDENLKVVFSKNEAVGFANLLPKPDNRVEILFFKPLDITDVSKSKAKKIIESWGYTHYSKYMTYLPTFATCRLANEFLHAPHSKFEPIVHSCHIDVIRIAKGGQSSSFMLDNEAEVEIAGHNSIAKKLYVSVYMEPEEFVKLNPRAAFPNIYITNWQRAEW